jgi:hypothetical protein
MTRHFYLLLSQGSVLSTAGDNQTVKSSQVKSI